MSPKLYLQVVLVQIFWHGMLLGVHSVQYFAETQMHHLLYNPLSQSRIPTKEGDEVRVSTQVL